MPLHAQQVMEQVILIDVRTPEEFSLEHLKGAINIDHRGIVEGVKLIAPDLNTPIELYCRSGNRSGIALRALHQAGFINVKDLGGLQELKRAGYLTE